MDDWNACEARRKETMERLAAAVEKFAAQMQEHARDWQKVAAAARSIGR